MAVALTVAAVAATGVASPVQSPPPQRSANPKVAAISGAVRDARTRAPIEGAMVRLRAAVASDGGFQLTDQKGRYIFSGLRAGSYRISVVKMGYADGGYMAGAYSSAPSFDLAQGEWIQTADVGLTKLAAIGGRVVDESGEPVVGLHVRALRRFRFAGIDRLAGGPVATTNDRGEYRIDELLPGEYFVLIPSFRQGTPVGIPVAESGLSGLLAYPPVLYPGQRSVRNAMAIVMEGGDERSGVDFALEPVPTVRVAGRLTGGPGGYGGYLIRLIPEGLEGLGSGAEGATTWAKADGAFLFPAVPAGDYTLSTPGSVFELVLHRGVFREEPFPPSVPGLKMTAGAFGGAVAGVPFIRYNAFIVDLGDTTAGYSNMKIVIHDKDVTGLEVPLQTCAMVNGQVAPDGATSVPADLRVELAAADASPEQGVRVVSVRADGTFRIPNVIPGRYAVDVKTTAPTVVKAIRVNDWDASTQPVTLSPGDVANMQVALTADGGSLSGLVRDSSGSVVPQAKVVVFPTNRQLWQHYGLTPAWIYSATAGRDGRYSVKKIRAGEYYILAVMPTAETVWDDPVFLGTASGTAARLILDWGQARHQDLVTVIR